MSETTTIPMIAVTDADFESNVGRSDRPVLVDFWAPWCAPCRAVVPTLDAIAVDYEGRLTVAKLNVDDNPETAARYQIRAIPTLVLFKDGEAVETVLGVQSKGQIVQLIERHLS